MKLGACIGLGGADRLQLLQDIGYQYVETSIIESAKADEAVIEKYRNALAKTSLKCESSAIRFPSEYNPAGEQTKAQLEAAYEQFYGDIEKTRWLGNEILVIGAGGVRNYPTDKGYDVKNVYEQLAVVCAEVISPAAKAFGLTVALEGLRKEESPTLNLTEQSVAVAKASGKDNIKVMTDYYHIFLEGEDMTKFSDFGDMIVHAHIANPAGRLMPAPGDGADYPSFFGELKKAGYNGRLSVEARIQGEFEPTMRAAYEEMMKYVY
ncbi:MAG: sugar phosphate isomerase/epimerase [Clostridia bacterium]|nr:sugar phosphate isomerase/epimerase [Clostridia bacterium]